VRSDPSIPVGVLKKQARVPYPGLIKHFSRQVWFFRQEKGGAGIITVPAAGSGTDQLAVLIFLASFILASFILASFIPASSFLASFIILAATLLVFVLVGFRIIIFIVVKITLNSSNQFLCRALFAVFLVDCFPDLMEVIAVMLSRSSLMIMRLVRDPAVSESMP